MTLLDEIAGLGAPAGVRGEREDVRAHILRICRLRRRSHLLAPDYGVDDPTHLFHSFPGGLDEWLRQLQSTLQRHEPRLRDVRVDAQIGDELDLTLRIEIRGVLATGDRFESTQFTAAVDGLQRWSMR